MTHTQRKLGDYGEQLAIQFLQQQGHTILTTNWTCPHGEIDIVSQDGACLVFVEVKTRHSDTTSSAFVAITAKKRQRMIASAYAYLEAHDHDESAWRIDVIAIALPHARAPIIDYVEDALDW